MLVIYGCLQIGGIETFLIRLAKERKKNELKTKLILLSNKNNSDISLINEMKKHADVYFLEEICSYVNRITKQFPLSLPINKSIAISIFDDVEFIHAATGMHALFADKIRKIAEKQLPISIAFYHPREFFWQSRVLPYFEKINRQFVLECLPRENLLVGPKSSVNYYKKFFNQDFSGSQTFRFGVIERGVDRRFIHLSNESKKNLLTICSVGRLVDFKPYNLWMLDVVYELKGLGIEVKYDIYGDGPLLPQIKKRIVDLKLGKNVFLKGPLPYSEFNEAVSSYHLFIGGGTAVVQASSLGIPSLVAVDSVEESKSPGYFFDLTEVDYTQKNASHSYKSVSKLIADYWHAPVEDKEKLFMLHRKAAEYFYMDTCLFHFETWKSLLKESNNYRYSKILYEISWLKVRLTARIAEIFGFKTRYKSRYVDESF